jgi:hypothetical protein
MEIARPTPTVVTQVTAEDLFQFSSYHLWHEPNQRYRVWASYLVAVAGVPWILANQVPFSLALLAGAAVAVAAPFLYRWYLRCEANRAVRAAPENYGIGTVQLLPEGIHEQSELGLVTIAWSVVTRIVVAPEAVYFYRGSHNAWIVPRRCFASAVAAEAFVADAQQFHAAATGKPDQKAAIRAGTGQ